MYKFLFLFVSLSFALATSGCIGKVAWIEREGGTPVKKRCIPVCPACQQVVNFDSAQCPNKECRILLAWEDKIIYPEKPYGADDEGKTTVDDKNAAAKRPPTPADNKAKTPAPQPDKKDESTNKTPTPPAAAPKVEQPGTAKDPGQPDPLPTSKDGQKDGQEPVTDEDLDNEKNW